MELPTLVPEYQEQVPVLPAARNPKPGQWVIDINTILHEEHKYDGGELWSIYRVPERLRQIQESAFAPQLVSIGPFHHKDNNLQAGNGHKIRFLLRLLGWKKPEIVNDDTHQQECSSCEPKECISLEKLEKTVKSLEKKARACYSEAFTGITSDEFVRMMVLDGCFIIEVLRLHYHNSKHKLRQVKDPIFLSHWMIQTLLSDFLMFENQLPLFVLQALFSLTMKKGGVKLETLARFFFNSLIDPNKRVTHQEVEEAQKSTDNHYDHLLHLESPAAKAKPKKKETRKEYDHLLHLFLCGFTSRIKEKSSSSSTDDQPSGSMNNAASLLHRLFLCGFMTSRLKENSATEKLSYHARELQEAGMEIAKKKNGEDDEDQGLLGIDIGNYNQLIRMHQLYLDDISALMLLNFVAFEQSCHHINRPYFTSYIVFLDGLIDNESDVEVLHKAGILNHAFGNNNDVANLINKVGRKIFCDPSCNYLHADMVKLNKFCKNYCASKLRTWWRNLIRNYFSSPWTAIIVFYTCTHEEETNNPSYVSFAASHL